MAQPVSLRESDPEIVDSSDRASLERAIEADVMRFVARELHDQVVQTLTTTLVDMERFKTEQFGRSSVQTEVGLLQDAVRGALNQLRTLLHDLRGQSSADTEFVQSLRSTLVDVFARRTGIEVGLSVSPEWPGSLSPRAALNLHRAVQEALNNVAMHAGARSVEIRLDVDGEGGCIVSVQDDGRGLEEGLVGHARHGLLGMKERAVLLGGQLSISGEPGRGTTVRLVVPAAGLS